MNTIRLLPFGLLATVLAACGSEDASPSNDPLGTCTEPSVYTGEGPLYSLGAVIQAPSAGRTLYVQALKGLDQFVGTQIATEIAGNARSMSYGGATYVGSATGAEITKYIPNADGKLVPSCAPRINLSEFGLTAIPFGNVFVSETKAYLFAEAQYKVIVWNPKTMEVTNTIDLAHLKKEGYVVELWVGTVKGNKAYVPLRYVNYSNPNAFKFANESNLVVIDTTNDTVAPVIHTDACTAAGQPAILDDGTIYMWADGRSYLAQSAAKAAGETPPKTCIVRIRPGETRFDPNYLVDIAAVTGGHDAATQFFHVGNGLGYAKVLYNDRLTKEKYPGFEIWSEKAFKYWQFQLGDTVTAKEVQDVPFSVIAFGGYVIDGKYIACESENNATSSCLEFDPAAARAKERFQMQGLLRELFRLK